MSELTERLELAINIALDASAIPLRYFQNDGLAVDHKLDGSPVTRADKETEEHMRQRIGAACPHDAILGEEYGTKDGSSGFVWYLDPIDGTQSYIRGVPLFGTMVALTDNGSPGLGVIVFPALGEIVFAARGSDTWWATNASPSRAIGDLERRKATVSKVSNLEQAAFSTTALAHAFEKAGIAEQYRKLLNTVNVGRGFPDCYGHYLVATGRIDVMLDPIMSVWDSAPLLPIVTGAGGRFTNIAGEPVIDGGSGLSTNGLLHDAVLAVLNSRPR